MSLILDALNRADNERKNQDTVPGLTTVHQSPVMVADGKQASKAWLYVLVAASFTTLMISLWLILKSNDKASSMIGRTLPANVTSHEAASAQSDKTLDVAVSSASAVPQNPPPIESFTMHKEAESVVAEKPTPIVEQLYSAPDAQLQAADPKVNELYTAQEPTESQSIVEPFAVPPAYASQPRYITDTGRQSVTASSRTFDTINNVQDFNELPWNTKQQIPTISYQRHNFLAGGVSSVVINGQTLGEGNIAGSGELIVQEIFADGVVLKRGNVIFKLRALNGWINM